MIEDFIRTYGSVIIATAALVAVFLTDWLNRRRERKSEEKKIQSVRTLIRLEIDQNLRSLQTLWDNVNQLNKEESNENRLKIEMARKLIELRFPNWKHKMWENQTSLLPVALSSGEIKKIYDIHCFLDDLAGLYWILSKLEEKQSHEEHKSMSKDIFWLEGCLYNFNEDAPKFWDEFEEITLKLLTSGNPIDEKYLWEPYELNGN